MRSALRSAGGGLAEGGALAYFQAGGTVIPGTRNVQCGGGGLEKPTAQPSQVQRGLSSRWGSDYSPRGQWVLTEHHGRVGARETKMLKTRFLPFRSLSSKEER